MNYDNVINNIREELKAYLIKCNLKSLVVGVSGGVDSALICALARPVCDELGIPLIGRSLPCKSNKEEELNRSNEVGAAFCNDYMEVNLESKFDAMHDCVVCWEEKPSTKIADGNIKARIRMVYLYHVAGITNGIVLSTDNLTEYLLGFWTLHGDVGDYGMIQDLWKTEVYAMTTHLASQLEAGKGHDPRAQALMDCVKAVPTDGLGISNSDLDQIGAKTYSEVDRILKTWLCDDEDAFAHDEELKYSGRPDTWFEMTEEREKVKDHPVVRRFENSHWKRNNPINIKRNRIVK